MAEDVNLHGTGITPGVFLISWVETSDMTLGHTMDLGTVTVHAFWTF